MTDSTFTYDVFLSHSAKDKPVVRSLAERLKADGLRVWFDEWEIQPGDNIPSKIEEGLERSRMLVLCMSADAFGSDWAQLESQTFRFRDPLNRERRLVPLRLDDTPVKGSLAQFRYVDWRSGPASGYALLLEACGVPGPTPVERREAAPRRSIGETHVQLGFEAGSVMPTILDAAFSPDGKRILGAVADTVHLWDAGTGECLRVFRESPSMGLGARSWFRSRPLFGTAWSPDQSCVLSGGPNQPVHVWDVETGRCVRTLKTPDQGVLYVGWSPDGQYVLSADYTDRTFRLWEVRTGRCLHLFEGHTDLVRCMLIGADNRLALSCAQDETLRLWEVETERCLRVLAGHTGRVQSIAWTADCRRAISASWDKSLRWWDVDAGECLRELTGHAKAVCSVALHADGRHALSASVDETARLWDLATGECLRVLRGHTGAVRSVGWGIEPGRAFSCDINGGLNSWDLSGFLAET